MPLYVIHFARAVNNRICTVGQAVNNGVCLSVFFHDNGRHMNELAIFRIDNTCCHITCIRSIWKGKLPFYIAVKFVRKNCLRAVSCRNLEVDWCSYERKLVLLSSSLNLCRLVFWRFGDLNADRDVLQLHAGTYLRRDTVNIDLRCRQRVNRIVGYDLNLRILRLHGFN
ncbi:hypothetical protein D3C84_858640 [compost metagenome]